MSLRVEGVSVEIAGRAVVREVSLGVDNGELVILLGPNGAGKSTLLSVLAGEREVARGRIEIAGQPMRDWRPAQLARHRAVMPQRVDVNFPLTVEDVLMLGRPPEPQAQSAPIIKDLLQRLDIAHLRHRRVPGLSGGEQQRVQLARVLAQIWDSPGPVVLLLDECTSALDPNHQQQVFGLLKRLSRERNFAILAVVHDLNLAARYGDRLLLLRDGATHCDDIPERALTARNLREVYDLKARIMMLPEGFPMVVPTDDFAVERQTAPSNASCRQAS
ncbi:heme ABC transporter ATP-binding protein [Marinobacter sp. M1N3S26]|uniref:heme ABC transporter ATP-binding protein n=1 Tax=unclassified Marinobacter TaxID=83889 RepID=UPI00387B4960